MPEGLEKDISPEQMSDLVMFLSQVEPPAKPFDGNQPVPVKADGNGTYLLAATSAEIRGPSLVFEPELRNLGYWHSDQDYAAWTVDIATTGRFDVLLEYSCHDDVQGNAYCLETSGGTIRGNVAGTGQWSDYRQLKIGEIDLSPGKSRFKLRADGPIRGALFDLRAIRFEPVAK